MALGSDIYISTSLKYHIQFLLLHIIELEK